MTENDDNNDVRRAASIGIGFVFSKSKDEVPRKVTSLTKSDNSSVRVGASLAIGISCAGTGMTDAISLLKPLLNDSEKAVRKNAIISMAMVMQQVDKDDCQLCNGVPNLFEAIHKQ